MLRFVVVKERTKTKKSQLPVQRCYNFAFKNTQTPPDLKHRCAGETKKNKKERIEDVAAAAAERPLTQFQLKVNVVLYQQNASQRTDLKTSPGAAAANPLKSLTFNLRAGEYPHTDNRYIHQLPFGHNGA